jgi:hypothetical protein
MAPPWSSLHYRQLAAFQEADSLSADRAAQARVLAYDAPGNASKPGAKRYVVVMADTWEVRTRDGASGQTRDDTLRCLVVALARTAPGRTPVTWRTARRVLSAGRGSV